MHLNRDNYELFAIDFIEGSLSPVEKEQFEDFLKQNPDISLDFEGMRAVSLSIEEIAFPLKEALHKTFPENISIVSASNFDMFAIAYIENDLNADQKNQFDTFLEKNPEYNTLFTQLNNTKLPQQKVVYPHKDRLKKQNSRVLRLGAVSSLAVAATIAFFFFIGPWSEVEEQAVADLSVEESVTSVLEMEEESKKPVQPGKESPSLKFVKGTKAPIPASTFKKPESKTKQQVNTRNEPSQESRKIAGINLKDAAQVEIASQRDRIKQIPVTPIEVNRTSLSISQLARYEYQRVSKLAEDDDQLILSLATNGIKELNRLTGSDMHLMASKDNNGDLSGIRFNSRFLNVTTPLSSGQE